MSTIKYKIKKFIELEEYEKVKKIIPVFLAFCAFLSIYFGVVLLTSAKFSLIGLLFTISYIMIFLSLIFIFPKKVSAVIFSIVYILFFIFSVTHISYYLILHNYFGISEIFYAGEGMKYVDAAIEILTSKAIIYFIVSVIFYFATIFSLSRWNNKIGIKHRVIITSIFLVLGLSFMITSHLLLGSKAEVNEWINYTSNKSTYDKWNDRASCISLTGIYEYSVRDIYVLFKDYMSVDRKKALAQINEYFDNNHREKELNEYTGIFENKNVIVVLLESIDSWLINSKNMPTLNKMKKTGLNFTNRYAPSMGGGNTYNSEYSLNTGLYIPINGYNIYDSTNNYYPYSLPNLFKNKGYSVNSIHFNQGYFYNRANMHKTFGYDNHYPLMDIGYDYHDVIDDEFLALNDDIYKLIVPDNDKFMSYVITYSAHIPYDDNELCNNHYYKELVTDNSELTCINTLSRITDNFLTVLTKRLEEDNKLDNTVLVLATDHYAYGYDASYIEKVKGGNTNDVLEKVPFIIWNNGIQSRNIDTYLATNDILPTLANMFNLDYNPNNYIGSDVFSTYHDNYVYFNNYTWTPINNSNIGEVNKKIDINDLIIESNYYIK